MERALMREVARPRRSLISPDTIYAQIPATGEEDIMTGHSDACLSADYAYCRCGTRVALTGATGFVGRQILRRLVDQGCQVRVLVRDPSRMQDMGVEVAQTADLFAEPPGRLRELLAGADILIHAAWYAEPGEYLASPFNVDCLTGTLNLARAFADVGGRRFVGIGTCAEYDTVPGVLTTETPLAPATLYASCKASTYLTLRELLDDFAWCRLFYLYGEGEDDRRLVPYIRKQLAAGQEVLLTRGEQVRDFIDVQDAGRMITEIALSDRQGAVNICSGEGVSVRDLAARIADEYGSRDLLRFGAKAENAFDPPQVVGVRDTGLVAGMRMEGSSR